MTLIEHIDDIRNHLKEGAFTNEAAVSKDIVLRLLGVLKWETYTPKVIMQEYPVEGRRVDFALCHPKAKPVIFIEVKQVGNIDGAEKQLFEYAFHKGVPILVLTDGQKWRFFHPVGLGNYKDRLVHELDFITENSEEIANRLSRYLNYDSVRVGEAFKVIAADYQNIVDEREIQKGLTKAWNSLLSKSDERLLKIMIEKTTEICGKRPTPEHVVTFLQNLSLPSIELTPIPDMDVVPNKPSKHTYEYAGMHLTSKMARQLITELFGDAGITQKQDIMKAVTKTHKDRGGLDANSAKDQLFNSALQFLERKRFAENIEKGSGKWEVYKNLKELE